MADVLEFPFENTKEGREMLDTFDDRAYLDQHVYDAIVHNLAHVHRGHYDISDTTSLEMVALIGRIHRAIGNWQMGYTDPLIPYLTDMITKLNLKKIHLVGEFDE